MPDRWFRILYSRNAFLRSLAEDGQQLETLSPMHAIRAMERFHTNFRPQHGDADELICDWGVSHEDDTLWEFAVVRRMTRHDVPPVRLRLVLQVLRREGDPRGSAPMTTWRDAAETAGYAALRGRRIRARALDQVTE